MGRFAAMASPCEVMVDTEDRDEAAQSLSLAQSEALRIERKFSRYRDDNIISRINQAGGEPIEVDDETATLLDYAGTCHDLSGGLFDITSGVLRRAWRFDGGDTVPDDATLNPLLELVGWHRVRWERPVLSLSAGMEIDFGGIGKEYAVDRAATLIAAQMKRPFLVNFGGDLFASGARGGDRPWVVGIDDPDRTGKAAVFAIDLTRGGLATSGDARRFVTWHGRRLGHILNPRTGWPVEDAPRSVTVIASTCLEAGTLATLAYLRGNEADRFLEEEAVPHWIF